MEQNFIIRSLTICNYHMIAMCSCPYVEEVPKLMLRELVAQSYCTYVYVKVAIKYVDTKFQLPISSWTLIRISISTTCVMLSCTVNFLIRVRGCDV